MTEKRISYKKFDRHRGGIILVKKTRERINIAARAIRHYNSQCQKIIWIGVRNIINNSEYLSLIKAAFGSQYHKITFFSYEDISFYDHVYLHLLSDSKEANTFCILDTGLHIRHISSSRTKRLLAIRENFTYRLLLSDNLFCCSVRDIYAQMKFICPHDIKLTETQFMYLYMPVYTDEYSVSKRWSQLSQEKRLMKWLSSYIIYYDLNKEIHIDFQSFDFDLTPAEKESYYNEKIKFLNKHQYILYLPVVQHFQYLYTICEQKVKALQKILQNINEQQEKVIIYLKYLGEIKFLQESGILKKYKYVVATGSSNKKKVIKNFMQSANILICTYKVNIPITFLQDCKNVIYFSQTFDYWDKIYIFSKFDDGVRLKVFDFWVNTNLENIIRDNLSRKTNMLANLRKLISTGRVKDL